MKKIIRISRARFHPAKSDEVAALLAAARRSIWPRQVKLPGYVEGYVGLDRIHGAMTWVTFWDTAQHADALGALPEMVASGEKFRAAGLIFEPITNSELLETGS